MDKNKVFIVVFSLCAALSLAMGIYCFVIGNGYGYACMLFLAVSIGIIISYINKIIKSNKKREEAAELSAKAIEKNKAFETWLTQQGFVVSDMTKSFLIDTVNRKWCKRFEEKIFNFSDAVGASINKHNSSETKTKRTLSKSGTCNNSVIRTNTRTSADTSTYEVLIKTTDINKPIVVIDCCRDKASAEKIIAAVDIMRGKKTRNRTKEIVEDNNELETTD